VPRRAKRAAAPRFAVWSRDDGIDPVGACVGLKGSRVQAVVNSSTVSASTSCRGSGPIPSGSPKLSLAPARVARVFSDPESKTIQAIVDEDQLSLANRPQMAKNVRLASETDRGGSRSLLEP